MRGKFITLEGVDGAGKSTYLTGIARSLERAGRSPLVTREPGGTELAEALRAQLLERDMDPLTETLLMFAARRDHVRTVIEPALASGRWVVCDRFTDATRAYQGGGKGVNPGLIEELARTVHPEVEPDLTLIFDVPFEISRQRLAGAARPLDRFERQTEEFFARVRAVYHSLAGANPSRIRMIDASGSRELVNAMVEKEISRF